MRLNRMTETNADQYMSPIPRLTGFNIRNGDQSEAKSLVVRANISRTWHWSPIEGLNPKVAIKKTYDFIRQEIARMTIHPETGVNHTLRRKKGIVIGVAKAVSTERYQIDVCCLFVLLVKRRRLKVERGTVQTTEPV